MKENSIEETIKQLELILKARKEHKKIIECAGGSCINCDPDIKALSKSIEILSAYKRVLKENEEINKKYDKDTHILQNELDYANADRIDLAQQNKELRKEKEEKSVILLAGAEKVKQLEKENEELQKENEVKDKVINEMAEYIASLDIDEDICKNIKCGEEHKEINKCVECVIKFFEKRIK